MVTLHAAHKVLRSILGKIVPPSSCAKMPAEVLKLQQQVGSPAHSSDMKTVGENKNDFRCCRPRRSRGDFPLHLCM